MEEQMWFCETCNNKYKLNSKWFHLKSNKHRFKELCLYYEELYRELYPIYIDYNLCRIKGFFEDMPYLSFLKFVVKHELINQRIQAEILQVPLIRYYTKIVTDADGTLLYENREN